MRQRLGTVHAQRLTELARELTQDFVPQALAKRIDLGFEGPPRSHLLVQGQPWQLQELLKNLIDNALRYTPPGGEVTVRLIEDLYGQVLVLQVEDSGPGIPEEAREQVFQPFHRLEASRNPATGGVGLGLTIARTILRAHGGDVILQDTGPGGTRFRLELPDDRADQAAPETAQVLSRRVIS